MKKSDLRDGMIVTYRNGDVRRVDGVRIVDIESGSFRMSLSGYNDTLIYYGSNEYDIMKVEAPIWEREDPKQAEIQKVREEMEALAERLKKLEEE